jgi:polysaccharide pyruvyl transferase WcaK-like protein
MKVLVYGWYNQLNIGDDFFVEAFQHLFPEFEFVFYDAINSEKLQNIDAVFFGGGSFLLSCPNITNDALEKIKSKKIFYLGVGVEAEIHPVHLELMSIAQLIATRSQDQVDRVKAINPNTMWIPDLVYCLQSKVQSSPKLDNSVLVIPNCLVIPQNLDPYWRHSAWLHFKSEFSQFLDWLIEKEYQVNFLSLCHGQETEDDWAASELIGSMNRRNKHFLIQDPIKNIEQVTSLISQYNFVVTQRFHGIILSEMTRTPYINLHHHDKLKFCQPCEGRLISYYNCSKQNFIDVFRLTINMKFHNSLPIESDIFETLKKEVLGLI